jgi:hypothetical protein
LQGAEGLTLGDAAPIRAFLADVDDERSPVVAARLVARGTTASDLPLEDLDILMDLVANLPDQARLAGLLRYCERADPAAAAAGRRPARPRTRWGGRRAPAANSADDG